MMNKLFTLLLAAACFTASAQIEVEYPYNPDNQNDGHVGIEDILEILTVYGEEFTPEQLLVEGTSLTEWIQLLSETVIQQQAQIDSLNSAIAAQLPDSSGVVPTSFSVANSSAGADYYWPLGLGGEIYWHNFYEQGTFTVPDDKMLFVLSNAGVIEFELDGHQFGLPVAGSYAIRPLIIPASTEVSCTGQWMMAMLFEDDGRIVPRGWRYGSVDFSIPQDSILCISQASAMTGFGSGGVNSMLWLGDSNSSFGIDDEGGYVVGHLFHKDHFTESEVYVTGDEGGVVGPCQGELSVNYHGYEYDLVEIEGKCWFQNNVRSYVSNDGAVIGEGVTSSAAAWGYYGNDASTLDSYGLHYNYEAALAVCPSGWHLPTVTEFEDFLQKTIQRYPCCDVTARVLKDITWGAGTNTTGFSAQPAGFTSSNGNSYQGGDAAWFWLSGSEPSGFTLYAESSITNAHTNGGDQGQGRSVRCVKDSE